MQSTVYLDQSVTGFDMDSLNLDIDYQGQPYTKHGQGRKNENVSRIITSETVIRSFVKVLWSHLQSWWEAVSKLVSACGGMAEGMASLGESSARWALRIFCSPSTSYRPYHHDPFRSLWLISASRQLLRQAKRLVLSYGRCLTKPLNELAINSHLLTRRIV